MCVTRLIFVAKLHQSNPYKLISGNKEPCLSLEEDVHINRMLFSKIFHCLIFLIFQMQRYAYAFGDRGVLTNAAAFTDTWPDIERCVPQEAWGP